MSNSFGIPRPPSGKSHFRSFSPNFRSFFCVFQVTLAEICDIGELHWGVNSTVFMNLHSANEVDIAAQADSQYFPSLAAQLRQLEKMVSMRSKQNIVRSHNFRSYAFNFRSF